MKRGALVASRNSKEHSFTTSTSQSRPNATLVKVESIFINIDASEQIKPGKCEHFTLRGFVSDSRERNGKLHWPLSVDGDGESSEEINPTIYPLQIPLFKSWRCQNCLNEIDMAAAAAAAKKGSHNITVNCSRRLKEKGSCSHRSLENVIAYLSKKLKQPSGRGRALCDRKFGSKLKQKRKQKQIQNLDSVAAINLNTRGLRENELRNATNGIISNQQDSLTYVNGHHKDSVSVVPQTTSASTKFFSADGSQHEGRHAAATKLVQLQQDDSFGTERRKNKAKKVRLLYEILEKDGKRAQPAMTKGFHTDECAEAGCSNPQSVTNIQFDNERCQPDRKLNNDFREQDIKWSGLHFANSVDGNGERRKAHGLDSAFENAMYVTSNEGQSDAVIEHADKMVIGNEQRADGNQNYTDRGQKTNSYSCGRQEQSSINPPLDGKVTDSLHNSSLSYSQIKGKSNDNTIHKVHQGSKMLSPSDNGKWLEGNNVTQKLMETIQIGHQIQYVRPIQDRNTSRRHNSFANGCLEARRVTEDWIPGSGNRNLRNDTAVYMGESSSAYKSMVDKNIRQGTNSFSDLKRPNQGPCGGNKKPKHSRRTEGAPTVVHQTEFLLRNISKKMSGMLENPENTLNEMRRSMIQEVGTSDDIPMEIVELMAKNQYERQLHEVGNKPYMQQSSLYPKNYLVGSTNTLSKNVSQGSLHENPHLPSAHVILEKKSAISKGKPNGHVVQRPSTGSTHRPLLSSQGDLSVMHQFPAVVSSKADNFPIQNCKYDMNKLASEQRVPARSQNQFELWRPASLQSDKTSSAWSMVPPNKPVHKSSIPQGNALHSVNVGEASKSSSYVGEGLDFSNLSLTGRKANNFRSEASHSLHPRRGDCRYQMMASPDPYANEAVPAMHLLSLSSASTNMDAVANRNLFDRSFTNDHLTKELSGNSFAVGESSHKRKQPSSYDYHKFQPSDASCQCSLPVPAFSSAAASLHEDGGDERVVKPSSHLQERDFMKVNQRVSFRPSENSSIKYQTSPMSSTVGVAFQQLIPARQLANHMFSPSWSVPGSSDLHINGNFYRYCSSVAHESYDNLNKRAELVECRLNENPMEFTTPGPGNKFMIGPEDLKLRKTYPPNVAGPMATNSFKQLGFIKYAAPNNRL